MRKKSTNEENANALIHSHQFATNINEVKIYEPTQTGEVLAKVWQETKRKRGGRVRPTYYNVSSSFDIETTSFYDDNGRKTACMYVWQFGIDGFTIVGRTYPEFLETLTTVSRVLDLNTEKRLIIYVHNLAYEFQFIRKWINPYITNVFALSDRKPVKVETSLGIEFRCSYILSGYSLETVGKNLLKYKVEKAVGFLDYDLPRHSSTELTQDEKTYIINDIKVVMAYIQEKIETDGDITKIQLTKTGYVRKLCREACYKDNYRSYRRYMYNMQISLEEYELSKKAYAGGFTHANALNTAKTFHNVASYDFTSSYPTVMVSELYPASMGRKVEPRTEQEFRRYLDLYCCIFEIRFDELQARTMIENPLSKSRCTVCDGCIANNGRVFYADRVVTTITNVDFEVYEKFYTWKGKAVGRFYIYERGYLPTPVVNAVLNLYATKTTLKGVEGYEVEYLSAKENVNSVYGMISTDPIRENITYTDEWIPTEDDTDPAEKIQAYNDSKNRFTFYPWACFVTAYARSNLFSGIYECWRLSERGEKVNYLYSDTDSIKVENAEALKPYIEWYNNDITRKLQTALEWHNLPFDLIAPKTVKGESKPLGVWDYETTYNSFRTLGSKRYCVIDDGKLSITVSGVNKRVAVPWFLEQYGTPENAIEHFDDGLVFPEQATGKLTHTYIDEPADGVMVDYRGVRGEYHELSYIHLSGTEYNMSMSKEYVNFLLGYRDTERGKIE